MKILLSAYACEPGKGSEPGVGWNVSTEMAKLHDVWVLTRANNREVIEAELNKSPVPGLNFIYYDLPKWACWWKKGSRGVQLYYILWQLFAVSVVRKWNSDVLFDCCHHLTFNQYRTLSFGYFLKIPFVIGPVGGGELIQRSMFRDLELSTKIREFYRAIGMDRFMIWFVSRIKSKPILYIFSNEETQRRLISFIPSKSEVLPAIGIKPEEFAGTDFERVTDQNMFKMIYAGRADDWKGIKIFLNALAEVKQRKFPAGLNIEVKLIGIRNEQERSKVQQWVQQFVLRNEVQIINFMKREQLLEEMRQCSLSVYPAFRDSGSMAVLEACAIGCPVICFDTPGQDAFPDMTVCKVSIKNNYEKTVTAFAEKIIWAIEHQGQLTIMSKTVRRFAHEELNWESKVAKISEFYAHILEEV